MNMWLFLAFLAIPLVEIGLFVVIGGAIGLWLTLIWVVVSAFLGIIVLKGVASLGPISLSANMIEMQDTQSPLAHRLLVAIAGGLLIIPGFLTDAVGLALLIPPLRRQIMRLVAWRLGNPASTAAGSAPIDGEWREVRTTEPKMSDSLPPDSTRH
jgi:UPF0716 protein FxsA